MVVKFPELLCLLFLKVITIRHLYYNDYEDFMSWSRFFVTYKFLFIMFETMMKLQITLPTSNDREI